MFGNAGDQLTAPQREPIRHTVLGSAESLYAQAQAHLRGAGSRYTRWGCGMIAQRGRESDAYGFPLDVTAEQQLVLKRCRATSQRRAARDWARDAATADRKGALRRRIRVSKKKSCRKVCFATCPKATLRIAPACRASGPCT